MKYKTIYLLKMQTAVVYIKSINGGYKPVDKQAREVKTKWDKTKVVAYYSVRKV